MCGCVSLSKLGVSYWCVHGRLAARRVQRQMQCSPRKGGINLPQASSLLLLGEAEKEDKDALPSLDTFLAKHTSEDNASFEQIMEVAKEKEKVKHAWLYSAEEEYTRVGNCLGSVSALPGGHSQQGNTIHCVSAKAQFSGSCHCSLFPCAVLFSPLLSDKNSADLVAEVSSLLKALRLQSTAQSAGIAVLGSLFCKQQHQGEQLSTVPVVSPSALHYLQLDCVSYFSFLFLLSVITHSAAEAQSCVSMVGCAAFPSCLQGRSRSCSGPALSVSNHQQ